MVLNARPITWDITTLEWPTQTTALLLIRSDEFEFKDGERLHVNSHLVSWGQMCSWLYEELGQKHH